MPHHPGHRHNLLPASRSELFISPHVATDSLVAWSFGRGSVIWRIWPAVLLHIAFAAAVVSMSLETRVRLALPPVLLTVLGVVIGFVISYRAMTGYDRYWMGRSSWADIIRNARAMGRIIWYHVPPYLTVERSGGKEEMILVMKEKRMALDLVEAFAVAVKHHLRGELGFYYEDLYYLIEPLHNHQHDEQHNHNHKTHTRHPKKRNIPAVEVEHADTPTPSSPSSLPFADDSAVPPINSYGALNASSSSLSVNAAHKHGKNKDKGRRQPERSVTIDLHCDDEHEPLLQPAELATQSKREEKISFDLVPFMSFFSWMFMWGKKDKKNDGLPTTHDATNKWAPPEEEVGVKKHPKVAGAGESVPLDVLRVLTEWVSVLEARGTAGSAPGGLSGCIASFEESLSSLEKILTTPLPFVYSAHIRHTVWIYLFFLPFQLVGEFGWSTIPGVGIAAFIYLGFLAAGEEIEQPFGYDSNDLDLDLFTGQIIHGDMTDLKRAHCLNAYHTHESDRTMRSISHTVHDIEKKKHEIVEWDGDGDGRGDGYGIGDDVFGIRG